jgi:hypothetical protein
MDNATRHLRERWTHRRVVVPSRRPVSCTTPGIDGAASAQIAVAKGATLRARADVLERWATCAHREISVAPCRQTYQREAANSARQ